MEKIHTEPLTLQEEAIMKALWTAGEGEISDILKRMPDNAQPYTTVASVFNKLETKGFVKRVGKKRGFVYDAAVSEREFYDRSLGKIVSNFFTGSYKSLVQHFAQEEKLTKEELREILEMIEKGEEA